MAVGRMILLMGVAMVFSSPVFANAKLDKEMRDLAATSGCFACHSVRETPNKEPIGPAWVDVAIRYRDQPGALKQLTKTVLYGSNSYYAHWKGKVTGYAMPPNAVAISPKNARRLVKWILALKK